MVAATTDGLGLEKEGRKERENVFENIVFVKNKKIWGISEIF